MEWRDRNTLIPINERKCADSLVIHSDEWPANSNLNAMGYQPSTVNHQQHYVDPAIRAHTQAIERSWLDAKTMILKKIAEVALRFHTFFRNAAHQEIKRLFALYCAEHQRLNKSIRFLQSYFCKRAIYFVCFSMSVIEKPIWLHLMI